MNRIYVGFCIAYDWHLLRHAIPAVYDRADVICLSIDSEHRSWADKPFEWNESAFRDFVKSVDPGNKIRVIEGSFHHADSTPKQNEKRQRDFIAASLGPDGWHIQLDCDEYFLDFAGFADHLINLPPRRKPYNVCCSLITLIKKVEGGFLYVSPRKKKDLEYIQIASLTPSYEYGRRNGYFNRFTAFSIVHQSWARERDEIIQKLNNWGHLTDFNPGTFIKFWDSLTVDNYKTFRNIHPIKPPVWPALEFGAGDTVEAFMEELQRKEHVRLSDFDLALRNSQIVAKLRSLF